MTLTRRCDRPGPAPADPVTFTTGRACLRPVSRPSLSAARPPAALPPDRPARPNARPTAQADRPTRGRPPPSLAKHGTPIVDGESTPERPPSHRVLGDWLSLAAGAVSGRLRVERPSGGASSEPIYCPADDWVALLTSYSAARRPWVRPAPGASCPGCRLPPLQPAAGSRKVPVLGRARSAPNQRAPPARRHRTLMGCDWGGACVFQPAELLFSGGVCVWSADGRGDVLVIEAGPRTRAAAAVGQRESTHTHTHRDCWLSAVLG